MENIIDFIHQCQTKMSSTIQISAQNAGGRESLRDHNKSFLLLGCFFCCSCGCFYCWFCSLFGLGWGFFL